VAVEVGSGPVVAHGGSRVGVAGCDLGVAQVYAGVEHGGNEVAVVAGFYRTCVIDGILPHSPADYVRRPNVRAQSATLGLSQLQFEAMLSAARMSGNQFDFALVCSPKTLDSALTDRLTSFDWEGTPGLGIFEFAHSLSSSYRYRPTLSK
jgi:hypothetical protein